MVHLLPGPVEMMLTIKQLEKGQSYEGTMEYLKQSFDAVLQYIGDGHFVGEYGTVPHIDMEMRCWRFRPMRKAS